MLLSELLKGVNKEKTNEIEGEVRKITYSNGVTIYINYSDETESMDGKSFPAMSYEMEGI